jgi:hypothetical protein
MILQLLKLVRLGYPNRTGFSFVKVVLIYFWLGMFNIFRTNNISIPTLEIASKVWMQYSDWLIFQILYIKKKDWARTPLIRDVTLVQTNPVSVEGTSKIGIEVIDGIQATAEEFSESFFGLDTNSYFNWLCRYHMMLSSFEYCGVSPLHDGLAVAEIGPGLGPVTSLLSKSAFEIHSFDTFEMQEVAKYVESNVIRPRKKIQYHAMNLASGSWARIENQVTYCVIAFYSFTEINLNERKKYFELIENSEYSIIATNKQFEGVSNFDFLENLAVDLNKKVSYVELETIFESTIPNYVKKHRIYLLQRIDAKSNQIQRQRN